MESAFRESLDDVTPAEWDALKPYPALTAVLKAECEEAMREHPGPFLIGIGHRKGVGKSYLAMKLAKQLEKEAPGLTVAIIPLSMAMKTYAQLLFGSYGLGGYRHYEEHPEQKDEVCTIIGEPFMTPRQVWIKFANAMRDIDENIWIDQVMEVAQAMDVDIVIIPDIRFDNEFQFIRDMEVDGLLVNLRAPSVPTDADGADEVLAYLEDDQWDFIFENDFEPKTMKRAARDIVAYMKEEGIISNG